MINTKFNSQCSNSYIVKMIRSQQNVCLPSKSTYVTFKSIGLDWAVFYVPANTV